MAVKIWFITITESLADKLLAIGTIIGILHKAIALKDPQTTWSRRASLPNLLAYPITALLPFYVLGLWGAFFTAIPNILIWVGIYKYRAPEDEDWKGNFTRDEITQPVKDFITYLKVKLS